MSGYTLRRRGRQWVAVFEFDADECEAIARAFGPSDGAYDEHMQAAAALRAEEEADQ